MNAGDNPRFVVTSLAAPTPQMVYEDLYCARGQCENDIKAVKVALRSDRTSATTFQCAPVAARVCGLRPPSCLANLNVTPHRARAGPALDDHRDPLQDRCADQTVQGSHPPPSAERLPGASTPASC